MSKPIKDRNKVRSVMMSLMDAKYASPLIVFYSFNLMSMVYRVIHNVGTVKIDNNFNIGIILLEEYANIETEEEFTALMHKNGVLVPKDFNFVYYKTSAFRLSVFFGATKKMCLYGNYLFKANDNKGRYDFDKKCTFGL